MSMKLPENASEPPAPKPQFQNNGIIPDNGEAYIPNVMSDKPLLTVKEALEQLQSLSAMLFVDYVNREPRPSKGQHKKYL